MVIATAVLVSFIPKEERKLAAIPQEEMKMAADIPKDQWKPAAILQEEIITSQKMFV
jgi:hypothetical protein